MKSIIGKNNHNKIHKRSILLSVITVSLNAAQTIERTIRSVIDHKKDHIEYIVIDGKSTDGTTEIIERYIDSIDCFICEKDEGIYDAMNRGVRLSVGEYVSFLNADDWYEPDTFLFVEKAMKSGASIIYGRVNRFENNEKNGYMGVSDQTDQERLFVGNIFCHQGLFVKRSVFEKIGLFDLNFPIYADYEWNLRAHCAGFRFEYLNMTIANYSYGGISSLESINNRREYMSVIGKYLDRAKRYKTEAEAQYRALKDRIKYLYLQNNNELILPLDKNSQYFLWGAGTLGVWCVDLLRKNGMSIAGVIDKDETIVMIHGMKVYRPEDLIDKITRNGVVIISTTKFCDDIMEYLINKRINKNRILTVEQIREMLYSRYTDDEWDGIISSL